MIHDGKLKVNGKVVRDPNFLIDKDRDTISYQNRELKLKTESQVYFIFNKPAGVMSTLSDPRKRITLKDYIKKIRERVYPVGRLDFNSEGLILLTNDGDLTQFIISAKNNIPKSYLIKIKGLPDSDTISKIKTKGVFIEGRKIRPLEVKTIKKTPGGNSWVQVTLVEGKKHVVRKMFQYTGHPVVKLKRISIGNIKLARLPSGHWRELRKEELEAFKVKFNYRAPGSRLE
jgi:23S rRNA pseudouridine2605 synthase